MTRAVLALQRARCRLEFQIEELEKRLDAGDVAAAAEYRDVVRTLATLLQSAGNFTNEMLSTKDMASRLGVTAKTLLRLEKAGKVKSVQLRARGTASRRWPAGQAIAGLR